MNFSGVYQREKRNNSQMYNPMHNSIASYWTEALQKSEMKHEFGDDYFINNLHLIPDPLKRNLADSLFMNETPRKTEKEFQHEPKMQDKVPFHQMEKPRETMDSIHSSISSSRTLGGIGAFFSGVVNVLTNVVFRTRSPTNHYDCSDDGHQGSQSWQHANVDQDKNGKDRIYDDPPHNLSSDMNDRATVISCESKLNQVLHLLSPRQASSPVWVRRRPKRVFVEPGSVADSFEDAFSPEDFVSVPDDSYIEYFSPVQYHFEETCEAAAQKTKVMAPVGNDGKDVSSKRDLELNKEQLETDTQLEKDNSQLKNDVPLEKKSQPEQARPQLENQAYYEDKGKQSEDNMSVKDENSVISSKDQLITSCEDKLSRLKALLQEKRMKCTKKEVNTDMTKNITPIESKVADKHFKNPNRKCSKRPKSKLKCSIEDDLVFANEVNLGTPPSVDNSPMLHNATFGEYFDEVCGRFRSASTCSEDSFQIVFHDSPKSCRLPNTSDCDSEDSFIVFDDSPDSCFMSNDVFGDSETESESEISDSGCAVTCKLAHTLTRTVSNLADDSLYEQSEDEVDFVNSAVENKPDVKLPAEKKTGLLLDDVKKKKCQLVKKVQFSTEPPKVHVMRVWAFAARQARAGHWERFAIDRERFKRRIADVEVAVSWVLKPQHRSRVMFQRFMPWWNQLKRKEIAEKKEAEKQREELRKAEEQRLIEDKQRVEVGQMGDEKRVEEQRKNQDEHIEVRGEDEARLKDEEHRVKEEEQRRNGEEQRLNEDQQRIDVGQRTDEEYEHGMKVEGQKHQEVSNVSETNSQSVQEERTGLKDKIAEDDQLPSKIINDHGDAKKIEDIGVLCGRVAIIS